MGQPALAEHQGPPDRSSTRPASSSELGIFIRSNDLFSDDMTGFMHNFANRQLKQFHNQLLAANSIVTPASFLTEVKGPRTRHRPVQK